MTTEVLRPACELAFVVARAGAEAPDPVEPPAAMRSFLYVDDLPRRAIAAAQQAIEENSEFRYRVALRADEAEIGRAGYLWLRRPPEWAAEFEALTAEADDLEDLDPDLDIDGTDLAVDSDDRDDSDGDGHNDGDSHNDSDSDGDGGDDDVDNDVLADAVATSEIEPGSETDIIEGVYQSLMAQPIELVSAHSPEPDDPLGGTPPARRESPLASVTSLADAMGEPSRARDLPSTTTASSLGLAAVTDTNEAEILSPHQAGPEASADRGGPDLGGGDPEFEADALENELASLRGLVERLANERDTVVGDNSHLVDTEFESIELAAPAPIELVEPEIDHGGLKADLDAAHHELYLSQADLTIARQEREEAQRQHSEALKRQVQLEKELAAVRTQKADLEGQLTSNQARVISVEERFGRIEGQLTDVEREREVIRSQLETMTLERNQIRDERAALRVERDEMRIRLDDVDEKTGGQDLVDLVESNRSMSEELSEVSRELDRMVALAEQSDERIQGLTVEATDLKAERLDLRSRLGEVETSLDVTTTQYDALKIDAERNAADLGALRAERDGLHTQLAELQTSLSEMLTDQADTRQRNDADRKALNELRVERDVMLARLADLEEAEINAKSRIDALVLERDELLSGRDELLDERGQLRAELTSSSADRAAGVDQLKTAEGRLATLETELQVERRQREELGNRLIEFDQYTERVEAEKAALVEQRDQLTAQVEALEAVRVDVEQLRTERDSAATELSETKTRLEQEAAGQTSEIERLITERDEFQIGRDELDERLKAALNELGGMEIRLGDVRREHDELAANRDQLTSDLEQQRLAATGLEEQLVGLQAALAEAEQATEEANVALQVKESELRTVLGARNVDASEIDKLRSLLADAKVDADERQGLGQQLESELVAARAEAEERESELVAVRAEAEERESELVAVRAEAEERESELVAVRAEVEERGGAGERLESELAAARAEVEDLQSSLAGARSESDDLRSRLAEAETAAERLGEVDQDLSQLRDELAKARVELATANAELEAHIASSPPPVPPSLISDADGDGGDELDSMAAELRSTLRGPSVLDSLVADAPSPALDEDAAHDPIADDPLIADTAPLADEATIRLADTDASVDGAAVEEADRGPSPIEDGREAAVHDETSDLDDETSDTDDDLDGSVPTGEGQADDLRYQPVEPAAVAAELGGDPADDDLDLVSELISQTVSGFAGDDLVDLRDYQEPDLDLGAELARSSGPSRGDALAIPSSPPSLLGEAAGSTRPAEQPDLGVRRPGGPKRRRIDVPGDIIDDEVAVARFVVSSPDVVLLVDGDSVAQLGWPKLPVVQQRDALVTYLADLSASSGAAPDVVFDGRIGDGDSLPASRAVRIRLSTPPTPPTAALDELVDAYPEQWPIALVTDDHELASTAAERGAAVLNNGQLLDLFIAE